ncbi:NAD kinase [Aerococcaceae bacterium DSM 111020]|nr:NAD kinase [Aerococcaceae bacterium DSM 111020]
MKTILIVANNKPKSQEIEQAIIDKIQGTSLRLVEADQTPDFIITIGGDGTLLSAFHQYQRFINDSRFIGIHTGHLGFYTDWRPNELDILMDELMQTDGASVSYPLVEIELTDIYDRKTTLLGLNECVIRSQSGTMVIDVLVKDYFLETFRGDGLCISTPTGSTGLNKSLGGAIIHPRIEALQLTEIAGINNRVYRTVMSPMLIPKDEWICLNIQDQHSNPLIQVDHLYFDHIALKSVKTRIAKESIHFAQFRHTHFWDRVEDAFLGNKNTHQIEDFS